jgi:hypothetical protein
MSQDNADANRLYRRLVKGDWRSGQQMTKNDLALAYFGSGFVTSSGRVFLPLIGRPKRVPSLPAERWVADSWPRWWQIVVLALICLMVAGGRFNGWSMDPLPSIVFSIGVPVAATLFWCWREQMLTQSWERIGDASITRTSLVIEALGDRSLLQSLASLGVIAFFTVWWGYRSVTGLVTLNLPFLPNFSAADSKRWAGLFLLVAFYSVLARAAYWQIVALIRKWNSRSS